MTEQSRQEKQAPESMQKKAKDSRGTVGDGTQHEAGITNRPLDEEQKEQDDLPPRGQRKEGSHA